MSVQEWGSLGELISGIGVLVTLIYLAFQVRESNQHSRFSAMETSRTHVAEYLKLRADPEVSRIWLAGMDDPDQLQPHERSAFYCLMTLTVNATDIRIYHRSLTGLPETEYDRPAEEIIARLAVSPGFRRWWKQWEYSYGAETRRVINEILGETPLTQR